MADANEIVPLFDTVRAGSCTSELKLKVNCGSKVNCRIKFGLVCQQLLANPDQILSYNSLAVYNSLVHDPDLSIFHCGALFTF